MAIYLSDLRAAVAAYMHRAETAFVENSKDNLLRAINNAKNYAQRAIDFEHARDLGQVTVANTATLGKLEDMKAYGTSTAMDAKGIQRAYKIQSDGSFIPLRIMGRQYDMALSRRLLETGTSTSPANDSINPYLVLFGRKFYVNPASDTYWGAPYIIGFDLVTWLADFSATSPTTQTSFLFDYCFDFLLFRTIYELNFFLKEEQRVGISAEVLKDVWNNVIQWNATMIGNATDDNTLD